VVIAAVGVHTLAMLIVTVVVAVHSGTKLGHNFCAVRSGSSCP
jgi:hypothetical protein